MDRKISIIVPCYNEESSVRNLAERVKDVMAAAYKNYELIFVNDGSDDSTLERIKELSDGDSHIRYISLSRNFGKEAAIYAGFCNADGDYVAVMDADLQDPPELLPEMIGIIEKGEYDSVATYRSSRNGEPFFRSLGANLFYRLINRHSSTKIVSGARDFRMMSREMADAVIEMAEVNRFTKGIYSWIGFKTYWIPYENTPRKEGSSKWSFGNLVHYAVQGLMDFTDAPLRFASYLGLCMAFVAFLALMFIIIRKLIFGDPVAGWASMICTIIFLSGIQLSVLGVIGEYLAKTFLESKKRPHYIISESNIENVKKIN